MKSLLNLYLIPLIVTLFNVVSNVLATLVTSPGQKPLTIAFAAIILFIVAAIMYRPKPVTVTIGEPIPIISETDKKRYSKKGLIVCISLYKPWEGTTADKLLPGQRIEAANKFDFKTLDFPKSNLAPAIEAVNCHKEKLEQCWFISTNGIGPENSSSTYVQSLIKYLQDVKGIKHCEFHSEHFVQFVQASDIQQTKKTRDYVDEIYKIAKSKYKISEDDMAADITGALKFIGLGVTLACLDGHRQIQLIGTNYDPNQKTKGLYPVIYDFEPVLQQN